MLLKGGREMAFKDEIISCNIQAERARKSMNQSEVAKKLGVTRITYAKIENNPTKYPINKLQLVADAIGCNVDVFFKKRT